MAPLFDGLYSFRRSFIIGKLSVFISVHRFEEISSALIDSALDVPDELSSEDYFPLCVSGSSAEAQADTGIQTGANVDWAIVLFLHAGAEHSGIAGIKRGDKNPGLQAQITFIKFINSKARFKPTSSPRNTSSPSSVSTSFNAPS